MRIQIYISVTALIFIHTSTSEAASRPPPPANVSIQCDSYGVEVRWEYPDLSRDVVFIVEVKDGDSIRKYANTSHLSLNISSMLSTSLTNRYCVAVKAERGGQQSELGESDVFSYNVHLPRVKICYLDFPEVELSPKDGKLHVQFINPLNLYRNTPALRGLNESLEYTVKTEEDSDDNKSVKICENKNEICETSIVFSEHGGNYCFSLTGEFKKSQRKFNPKRSCYTGDIRIYPPFTVYLYPVLGVVLTLLFLTGIIMLLVKKYNSDIKKTANSVRPTFLDTWPTQTHRCKVLNLGPEDVASDLQIEPDMGSKEQTTLLEIPFYSDEKPAHEDEDEDEDEDEGSVGLDTENPYGANDLDEADPDHSLDGYDCPHALTLEMSPGDRVQGYGR